MRVTLDNQRPKRATRVLGWAALGWAGLRWAGLGCAGLSWAALGWGWAGLRWAGQGWAGLGQGSELIRAFVDTTMHVTLPGITMLVTQDNQRPKEGHPSAGLGCAGLGLAGLRWAGRARRLRSAGVWCVPWMTGLRWAGLGWVALG